MLVKPFTRFDWDSWAGAEPTGKGAPAIGYATPDPTDKPSDAMEAIVIVDGRGISVTYLDHTADLVVTYELQVTFAAGLAIAAALQEDSLSLTQLRALGFTGEPDSLR